MVAVSYLVYLIHDKVESTEKLSSKLNYGITFGTAAVQIVGTYGSLALAAWKDRGQLAESLRRIQVAMPMSKEMLKKCRIASITAAVATTILVRTIQSAY